jgi:hypothetical protein
MERFLTRSRTPECKNPAVEGRGLHPIRSGKEVLLMHLLVLIVVLGLLRKRRTKLKIEIDL